MRCLDTWILVVVLDSGRPLLFFFNDTAPTEIYTLSLHDALPILAVAHGPAEAGYLVGSEAMVNIRATLAEALDRKSTRLNSSHSQISYAVFCLKKKKTTVSCRPADSLIMDDPLTRYIQSTHCDSA